VSILLTHQATEVTCGTTGEMDAGALQVLEYPSEDSAVSVPAEPIGVHPSEDPLPSHPANGFLPNRVDKEVREPKENDARIVSPRIRSPKYEEMAGEPETSVDLSEFSEHATRIPSSELAGIAEEMRAPDTAVAGTTEPCTPLGRSAAPSPHRDPSSVRKAAASSVDGANPPSPSSEPLHKPRNFSEPVASPTQKNGTKSERKSDPNPRSDSILPIRLQLMFGSGGSVKKFVLIPHRGEGMPGSFEVATVAGDHFELSEAISDSYESLPVSAFDNALSDGAVFQARSDARRWRWELTRREIYILAAGDAFGLSGFVTRHRDQRLWLNTKHAVLATEGLRDQVIGALDEAGCRAPEVCDSTTPGVPAGWILIRDVTPTRAVPMREEQNILNVLCPGHEIEPQFTGGIRLERSV
jgi:hypothetical protein